MPQKDTLLVTGAYGLLGKRVVALLASKYPKNQILAHARSKTKRSPFSHANIKMLYGDLCKAQFWKKIPKSLTHIFHVAAKIPTRSTDQWNPTFLSDNLLPIMNLIAASKHWPNLKQIIYSSSISVYGCLPIMKREDLKENPDNYYAASKFAGEILLKSLMSRDISVVCLRYSSLYDNDIEKNSVLPTMIRHTLARQTIEVHGTGKRTQDFVSCQDAALANLLAYQKNASGVFNIGSGDATTMFQLAKSIKRTFSEQECKIVKIAARDSGISNQVDIRNARKSLNYKPSVTLREGLKQIKQNLANGAP